MLVLASSSFFSRFAYVLIIIFAMCMRAFNAIEADVYFSFCVQRSEKSSEELDSARVRNRSTSGTQDDTYV